MRSRRSVALAGVVGHVPCKSESTHALALGAAKKRDTSQANHNARVQREYELHHND